jgi:hypothetical protein
MLNLPEYNNLAYVRRVFFRQFPDKEIDLTVKEIYQAFSMKDKVHIGTVRLWLKKEGVQVRVGDKRAGVKRIKELWDRKFCINKYRWLDEIEATMPNMLKKGK